MKKTLSMIYALLAALLFGINAPLSKLLVVRIPPLFLASLLYLGAGVGMLAIDGVRRLAGKKSGEARLSRKDLPYVALMILLDILAPIFLLLGLEQTDSGIAALLGNFEIAATALVAMVFFREAIGKRLWIAIVLIFVASSLLSVQSVGTLHLSAGALLVLLACLCWGLENNCTRQLSLKDPLQVVIIKGFGSGLGALLIAAAWGEISAGPLYILLAMILGFVAFGLSIFFYVSAQRTLGAARTSTYYAAAPFMGVVLSWVLLREPVSPTFMIALAIMLLGAYFAVSEKHLHAHIHSEVTHEHRHSHEDGHHVHPHPAGMEPLPEEEHSHMHTHPAVSHIHAHLPDEHHRHTH